MSRTHDTGPFPRAMTPPAGPIATIDPALLSEAVEMSRKSPRQRIILPFHRSADDGLQRMLNAIQPGSYIRPHRHAFPPKAESIVVLKGAIGFIAFDDKGSTKGAFRLSHGSGAMGIDVEAGVFHTFFAVEPDTVLFEAKPGPYVESADKDFADWAPAEGSDAAPRYLSTLYEQLPLP